VGVNRYCCRTPPSHLANIVTGAALIMLATFAAFAPTNISNIQQIGVGLGAAIAVDASVVRLVILTAVMRLAGCAHGGCPTGSSVSCPSSTSRGSGTCARATSWRPGPQTSGKAPAAGRSSNVQYWMLPLAGPW
jgi:hypothetical protein